jgi:ubiquitin-protein ligase
MDLRRLKVEAAELSTDSDRTGVSAKPISEDMLRWKGTINGPPRSRARDGPAGELQAAGAAVQRVGAFLADGTYTAADGLREVRAVLQQLVKETPCDGCTFAIDIDIELTNYPFEPPKMKFDTTVSQSNVSSRTGAICLEFLQWEWSPALTIKATLLTVQALLAEHLAENTSGLYKGFPVMNCTCGGLEARCLALAMVSHRRLGKDSLWAKAAIDDSILRMVCEEHDLFSQTCSVCFCQTLGKRLTFQAVSKFDKRLPSVWHFRL